MKKSYQKPALFAESFELMEHISGACGEITGRASYRDAGSCHYNVEDGKVLFVGGQNGCVDDPGDGDLPDDKYVGATYFCEYTFSEGFRLFAS